MSMQDREARNDRHRTPVRPRPSAGRGGGRLLLLVLVLAVLGAILWRERSGPAANAVPAASLLQRLQPACADPFPPAGLAATDPSLRNAAAVSATQFVNRTPVNRMVDLLSGERVMLSIAVPANQTSTVPVPVGAYGWRLRNGAAWCAATGTFLREQRTTITNGIQIVATSSLAVHIEPDAQHPSGFALRTSDRPVLSSTPTAGGSATAQPLAGGGLLIPRAPDGHYYLDGTIDGERVQFMIDTGASGVAIPAELARRLGHDSGPDVVSNTANGQTTGYAVRVARLAFGPFFADDVKVTALPALAQPLLGMSLLQSLEIRQTAAGLELRPAR
jgi:clan AA aspartic protease (TIGR02281 family)